jgi:anaerobic ribonucleoside-triphosphate reductase
MKDEKKIKQNDEKQINQNDEKKISQKKVGEGVGFERIRRITGYLVGTVDRFNNGKRSEEHDRVKHSTENL